jgi:ketosteroid isomerase-like protein
VSENVDVLREAFEVFGREGAEGLLRFAHPDLEIYTEPGLINTGTYHGHEEFLAWSAQWMDAWENFSNEPREFIEVGDSIVVIPLLQKATGKGSGIEVEMELVYLVEMRDGKASRLHLYVDKDRALKVAEELIEDEVRG